MLAILRDLGLEDWISKDAKAPGSGKAESMLTADEKKAKEEWLAKDAKARTRIELAIGDSEMIHISGAHSASQMWKQLTQVKESKGRLGVLATRRALYRAMAEEGFDMVEHISSLRKLQEELHAMDNLVSDEDWTMVLITSLPESWDNYTSSYLGASGNKPTLSSFELVAILIEEEWRRKGRGDSVGATMQAGRSGKSDGNSKECFNCKKNGHTKAECWSKGGGREGQGPKGRKSRRNRANQATEVNNSLNDATYIVIDVSLNSRDYCKDDWYYDSATTSHICTSRDAFTKFTPLQNAKIGGIGPTPAIAKGRGTVTLNFDVNGKTMRHQLSDVLYIPDAPNCLLLVA